MSLLGWFNKRRAKKAYAARLPSLLESRYGKAAHYSPQQIKSTVDDAQMSNEYLCYAIAMFASRDDFQRHYVTQPLALGLDYDRLRSEMASPDSSLSGGEFNHSLHEVNAHHATHSDYGGTSFDSGSSMGDTGM
jgi:hypothetical protein